MSKPQVVIYTDGSCNSDGKGAWAAYLRYYDDTLYMSGNEEDTTNNRMEIMAVIRALSCLTASCKITLYTDSQYVRNGILSWAYSWKRNGWKTNSGGAVKNRDLWEQILELRSKHHLKVNWVKGHAGHVSNEIVDSLAQLMTKLPV